MVFLGGGVITYHQDGSCSFRFLFQRLGLPNSQTQERSAELRAQSETCAICCVSRLADNNSTKNCFACFEVSSEEPALDKMKAWFFLYPGPLEQASRNARSLRIPLDDHSEPQNLFVV